ncbi:hypothetical protein QOZ80_1BG0068980 [Eleusine coracana subsp. coracana]|nr:hypothetical protein QOZ80_1BG0068980 [Eleusine coracana subsp. coracana]
MSFVDAKFRPGDKIRFGSISFVANQSGSLVKQERATLPVVVTPSDLGVRKALVAGRKIVGIEKYDGKTDPREWLHVYAMAIRALGGDSFVMANYLHMCLAPAARTWLTNLPNNSIDSWAELCRQFVANFQAMFDRPGNHWELARIKQRDREPLREYIQCFCQVKNTIPNISDAQVVTAFQGGLRDDDLIKKIGRLDAARGLSAKELFTMANKYAAGNSALFQVRQYKDEAPRNRNQAGPSNYNKDGDRKRKPDRTMANTECPNRRRVLVDGGSSLDILFVKTFKELGIPLTDLKPSRSPFHGVIPGMQTIPLGQITLPVTFGTRENYRTECITFEVADLDSTYDAIIGRPSIAKFMAIPHYPYMMMKLPGSNGVISLHSDVHTSYDCDNRSYELTEKKVAASELDKLKMEITKAEEAMLDSPPKKTLKATVQTEAVK